MENQANDLEKSMSELDKAIDSNYQIAEMNVFKKIYNVMTKINYLSKDGTIRTKNYSYNYLSEEKITNSIRQAMIEEKLILFPVAMEVVNNSVIENVNKVQIRASYKIVDIDTGIGILVETLGEGQDYGDKGIYKAMTGAFKYAQRETFMIPTGDDPDREASEPIEKKDTYAHSVPVETSLVPISDQLILHYNDNKISVEDKQKIDTALNGSEKAQSSLLSYLNKKYGS